MTSIPLAGPDLVAAYRRLRDTGPVHRVRLPDGSTVWLVTGEAEARAALADPRLSLDRRHSRGGWAGFALPPALDANLLNMDPPDHTRIRHLAAAAFAPARIAALRPYLEGVARTLLDAEPDDLVAGYAEPLAAAAICEVLGIVAEDRGRFRQWTGAMLAVPTDPDALRTAIRELHAYLLTFVAGNGLSALLPEAHTLTGDEQVSLAFLLLIAGYENPVSAIGSALLDLVRGGDGELSGVLADRTPAPVSIRRFPTQDLTIGGVPIAAGETVLVALAGAPALAFGHGAHACLGAGLARLEVEIGVRMAARYRFRLAISESDLSWRPSFRTLGLVRLPVWRETTRCGEGSASILL